MGHVFQEHGHELLPFDEVLVRASSDTLVCRAAEANDAILVAFDRDMRNIARQFGITNERFKRLSLLRFECSEPMAAKRLHWSMSLVEHEWKIAMGKLSRRLFVVIGRHVIRTHR